MINPRFINKQSGLTIIEFMVSVALGMVAVAAAGTATYLSQKNYTTQEALARLQENGRIAMQMLTYDIRMAGFFGCADDIETVTYHVDGSALFEFNALEGLEHEDAVPTWYPSGVEHADISNAAITPNTDGIQIEFLDPDITVKVEEPYMNQRSGVIHVSPNAELNQGDIVAVTDCDSADVFQITTKGSGSGNTVPLGHTTGNNVSPGNLSPVPCQGNKHCMSKTYEEDSHILKFNSVRYFISDGPNGPGLVREALINDSGNADTAAREIVQGIENMQITYGEDTDNDRIPDAYRKANEVVDWGNVISARVGLLARSMAQTRFDTEGEYGTEIDTRQYDLDGDGQKGSADADEPTISQDRVVRQEFVSTIYIRNLR